ncbi:unnamed protein product [Caenorhabditis auriculariae]|uniref:Uncharacterized protein n=1 Tax=Caenorhabditis auriculariae TaxID=2777116 RepID=A0A8S1HYL9_9PELO|nr:unnamed protein product [Caenorhabditis auriculariae]
MELEDDTSNLNTEMSELVFQAREWAKNPPSSANPTQDAQPDEACDALRSCLDHLERAFVVHVAKTLMTKMGIEKEEDLRRVLAQSHPSVETFSPLGNQAFESLLRGYEKSPAPYEATSPQHRSQRKSILNSIVPMSPIASQESGRSPSKIPTKVSQNRCVAVDLDDADRNNEINRSRYVTRRRSNVGSAQPRAPSMPATPSGSRRCLSRNPSQSSLYGRNPVLSTPTSRASSVTRLDRFTPRPGTNETPLENRSSRLRREMIEKKISESAIPPRYSLPGARRASIRGSRASLS